MSKTVKFECTRRNVSPKEFYNYAKKQAAKKNINLELDWLDYDNFIEPAELIELDKEEEKIISKPLEYQFYLKNSYNFIIEFNFDDDKKGVGYCYIEIIEEDKEEDSKEETKTVETVEEKQEEETIIIDESTEINGQKLNIKRLNNIKKPANIKLNHFTVKLINNNKELSIKTVNKIIANILKEFVINEINFYYIKFNKNWTGEVKNNNGFNDWLDSFQYDDKGNVSFSLDDPILLKNKKVTLI